MPHDYVERLRNVARVAHVCFWGLHCSRSFHFRAWPFETLDRTWGSKTPIKCLPFVIPLSTRFCIQRAPLKGSLKWSTGRPPQRQCAKIRKSQNPKIQKSESSTDLNGSRSPSEARPRDPTPPRKVQAEGPSKAPKTAEHYVKTCISTICKISMI